MGETSNMQTNLMAAGSVSTAGVLDSGGGVATARTGAGVYTLTMPEGVDVLEAITTITPKTAGMSLTIAHTSDTVKTVSSLDTATAGTPTDCDFEFKIERLLLGH